MHRSMQAMFHSALRRGRYELHGRRQGRGGGRRARLRTAIREREAPTVQTSGQKHLSSTLTLRHGTSERDTRSIDKKRKGNRINDGGQIKPGDNDKSQQGGITHLNLDGGYEKLNVIYVWY